MQNFTDLTYYESATQRLNPSEARIKRHISDLENIQIKLVASSPIASEMMCAMNCFLYMPTQVVIKLQGYLGLEKVSLPEISEM